MWLKLTHCRWCESERWGWEVSTDEGIRERGRRVLTWVAAAFTGLYLAHKPVCLILQVMDFPVLACG